MEKVAEVLIASAAFYLAAIALVLIALGWCLSEKLPRQVHWMAHRRIETDMPAEEQAEQIIEAIWPEEVL